MTGLVYSLPGHCDSACKTLPIRIQSRKPQSSRATCHPSQTLQISSPEIWSSLGIQLLNVCFSLYPSGRFLLQRNFLSILSDIFAVDSLLLPWMSYQVSASPQPIAANPVGSPMYPPHTSAQQAPNSPVNPSTLGHGGYPELASFFSRCSRYLHMRRFSALAVRLLLYRQHEIRTLEKQLEKLEREDACNSNVDNRSFSNDFAKLKEEGCDTQKRIYETLKLEMKEYGK